MEMHQVRYFLAVVSHLNFTRAAEELQVAQPSLTRAIQKLESELGGALFRRERRNTHLTELGRTMLPHLKAAFVAAETAKNQAKRLQQKDIGSLSSLGVCSGIDARAAAALVVDAARKLTNVDISVEVAETEVVERRLLAGEFDAAIVASLHSAHERFVFNPILTDESWWSSRRGISSHTARLLGSKSSMASRSLSARAFASTKISQAGWRRRASRGISATAATTCVGLRSSCATGSDVL